MGPEPLRGIRVLDLTNVLAGPYCCYQLALLGAEVIKVERPGSGDLARNLGADPARNQRGMGISFLAQNAGKKSITLNMKADKGKALLKQICMRSDVLVENFRPGVMDRLRLGYEVLKQVRPELVYCAISGYGQSGPRKGDPAYDQIVQGVSGAMAITGTADGGPTRVGFPLADTLGGMTAAFVINAALNARPRGAFLDVSMTEAVLSAMGWVVSNQLLTGAPAVAHGNENPTSAPSGTFEALDGPINIAANRDEQWEALARHLGREDLIAHDDYLTREKRKENRDALRAELEAVLRLKHAEDWVRELNGIGVPCGPVLDVAQALDDPQVSGRGLIQGIEIEGTNTPLAASPVMIDGVRPAATTGPPALGADNEAVWGELGLSQGQIAQLKNEGVI